MFGHRFHPKYFSRHLDTEIKEIYWETIIASLALSMVLIFEPIYLFTLGFSISKILLFFAQVYGWYLILIPLGAKFAGKWGYKKSIFISNIFYVLYWILLFLIGSNQMLFFVAPIFFALQKTFFWPAYNADIAINSGKKQTGREVGALFATVQIVSVIGPFIGGVISYKFGFMTLFVTVSVLMLVSVYPLSRSPEMYSTHIFTFRNFWNIWKNKYVNFIGYWGFAPHMMMITIWPVVIFLAISNVFGVGVITTVASALAAVLMLYIGRLTDKMHGPDLVKLSSLFYSMTWVFRFLALGVPAILAFDVLTKFGQGVLDVEGNSLTFEIAGSQKADYAIAYSVFYEFSLSVGKIVLALGGIWILALGGSISMIFVLAGALTLLFGLLRK
ncbi:MAG: MFS transporter [bacterium]|nr:MFS transporter [bacterium]